MSGAVIMEYYYYPASSGGGAAGRSLGPYSNPTVRPGHDPHPGVSYQPFYPKITPAAAKVIAKAVPWSTHIAWTWNDNRLYETFGPKIPSGDYEAYRVGVADGPLELTSLRFGEFSIPGAVPQPFGGPSGNQASGIDAPLVRGMSNGFFGAALRSGGSLGLNIGGPTGITILGTGYSDLRGEFGNQFGQALRDFFNNTPPAPQAPPPAAAPSTSDYVIYVFGEDANIPPTTGGNEPWIVNDGGPREPAGGAAEKFLPLIDSTLSKISDQLSAITSKLNRIKEPNPTNDPDKNAEKSGLLDLLAAGADILGKIIGAGSAAADIIKGAKDAALAAGDAASALDEVLDEFGDLIDGLIAGPEDDLTNTRFDKMADLFQYQGKSFTEYLYLINEALRSPQPSGSLDKEGLTEVLDKYLLASTAGGVEGNITDYVGVPYWTQEVPE